MYLLETIPFLVKRGVLDHGDLPQTPKRTSTRPRDLIYNLQVLMKIDAAYVRLESEVVRTSEDPPPLSGKPALALLPKGMDLQKHPSISNLSNN